MMISPSNWESRSILAGATRIGLKHIHEGLCNQDSILFRQYPFGTVLAVADGVGSECYSQYGSESAVKAVHAAFTALATQQIAAAQITDCIMREYVEGIDEEFKDHASTTCIYAAFLMDSGLYLGQAGDGICGGMLNGQDFILRNKADDFTNVVVPLSASRNVSEWTVAFVPVNEIKSGTIMLATDGVSEDIVPGKEGDFIRYVVDHLSELPITAREGYLQHLLENWTTPKSIDDKTFCFYSFRKDEE